MKLFTTKSIETVKYCQEYFDFSLLSVLLTKRVAKFEVSFECFFCLCYNCLISFVLLIVFCLPCLLGEEKILNFCCCESVVFLLVYACNCGSDYSLVVIPGLRAGTRCAICVAACIYVCIVLIYSAAKLQVCLQ